MEKVGFARMQSEIEKSWLHSCLENELLYELYIHDCIHIVFPSSYTHSYLSLWGALPKVWGGVWVKQIRIIFNTGEVSESGGPILRRSTYSVSDSVGSVQAEQIASLIGSLSDYSVQEAFLITVTQVI